MLVRPLRPFWASACLLAMGVAIAGLPACQSCGSEGSSAKSPPPLVVKVSMMSQCPFGNRALRAVTRAIRKLDGRVDLEVDYLGQVRDGVLHSIRGDAELTGDKLGLCAQTLAKSSDSALTYLDCQASRFESLPNEWEDCAVRAKIDVGTLRGCAEGKQGIDLVRKSFQRNQDAQVTGSPTVFLPNGSIDTGSRHSEAYLARFCAFLTKDPPPACSTVGTPSKVTALVVGDERCKAEVCDTQSLLAVLRGAIPGVEIRQLDAASPEGKRVAQSVRFLPVAVIDSSLARDEEARELLGPGLTEMSTGDFLLSTGSTWDPTAELCDDREDNDGDGSIDCADSGCRAVLACRLEKPNSLSVYLAEGSPFSERAIEALAELAEFSAKVDAPLSVTIGQVGKGTPRGLAPLQGVEQLPEVVQQLCFQAHVPRERAGLDYLQCRSHGTDVGSCLEKRLGFSGSEVALLREKVQACKEGGEGKALALTAFFDAARVPVPQTPHLLVNNLYELTSYSPDAIANEVCRRNPGHTLCSFRASEHPPMGEGEVTP